MKIQVACIQGLSARHAVSCGTNMGGAVGDRRAGVWRFGPYKGSSQTLPMNVQIR